MKRKKSVIPEPEDKLDAATQVAVSGPEDVSLDWRQIDWRQVEENVRRLRQRIFTASKAGDLERVRRLQKLMLRSRSNTLVSVRRVTERNAGRLTAGVDGEVAHDGSTAVIAATTPVRVVCMNTLNWGLQRARQRFSIRHTEQIGRRVGEARRVLDLSIDYYAQFTAVGNRLASERCSERQLQNVLDELYSSGTATP